MQKKISSAVFIMLTASFVTFCCGYFMGNARREAKLVIPQASASGIAVQQIQDPDALINLNAATAAELTELPGIGEKLAEMIVAHREENGPFSSVWEVIAVDGIGEKKLEQIVPYLTLK